MPEDLFDRSRFDSLLIDFLEFIEVLLQFEKAVPVGIIRGSHHRTLPGPSSLMMPEVVERDQVEACRRIFESDTKWTVVRGSDLEEGESQGMPVWSRHVGDPILESNLTRRSDFALFMVAALENDELIHEAPAIVGCQSASALAHASVKHDT